MGFLSRYDGTVRVQLDDEFWVDVKVMLSKGDHDAAERRLMQMTTTLDQNGKTVSTVTPDSVAYQEEMVVRSLVSWNLTDERDAILPIAPVDAARRSLRRLPTFVSQAIYEKVAALNAAPPKGEIAGFREDGGGGDHLGADVAPDTRPVLDGSGVLDEVGADPG